MQPLDLIDFADHSAKIPAAFLNQETKAPPVSNWKITLAHMIDFTVVFAASLIVVGLFAKVSAELIAPVALKKVAVPKFATYIAVFTSILWGYYFCSYFMNHGQSLGLYAVKKRIRMNEQSLRQSFAWSVFSFVTCFTGGAFTHFADVTGKFAPTDYLYHDLLRVREEKGVDLFESLATEESVTEDFARAA